MRTGEMEKQIARWNTLSEAVFGQPEEVDAAEAEQLLETAGIDPAQLKASLHQRMVEKSKAYTGTGRPVPTLLQKALEDLDNAADKSEESADSRDARRVIARLLQEIAALPKRLNAGVIPAFTAAYRNRRELSARDKETLDAIAEDLRRTAHE